MTGEKIPQELRLAVLARDLWRCQMWRDGLRCGRPAEHVNHKRRRRDGGATTLANLEAACADCNTRDGGYSVATPKPAPSTLTPAQRALVAALDSAGAPSDVGRRSALRLLKGRLAIATRVRSADVDAACAWRRGRQPVRAVRRIAGW